MRRPLIAGNWKMNLNLSEAETLAQEVAEGSRQVTKAELAVCPPSVYVHPVRAQIAAVPGAKVALGAQNIYFKPSGAFTGEISAPMLRSLQCTYVILGHSERRHVLGETDEDVNRKVHAALAEGLIPIVCVGETQAQRDAGQTAEVVSAQIAGSLKGLTAEQMQHVVIAYEPVWAIGGAKAATPADAEAVHADLRRLLATRYNAAVADSVRILYGGAVKPDNAADLLKQKNIDGALVGGASLKASTFLDIVKHVPEA